MKQLLFILFSFLTISIHGQEKKKPVAFGLKAGVLLANAGPDYADGNGTTIDYSSKFGIVVGGRLQYNAGKNFTLMPEITLVAKGANIFTRFDNGTGYNEFPELSGFLELTANLLFTSSSNTGKFMIGGGPSVATNLDNYSSLLGNSDFGVNILAGYQLPIGFSFEINFNKGLINQEPKDAYNSYPPNLKTSSLGFSIGYLF